MNLTNKKIKILKKCKNKQDKTLNEENIKEVIYKGWFILYIMWKEKILQKKS